MANAKGYMIEGGAPIEVVKRYIESKVKNNEQGLYISYIS